jgi:ribosomal protein S18 acetylase RimI-like enzyme
VTVETTAHLEIFDLPRADLPEAVAVLSRAMRDNPIHVVAWGPDPETRRRTIERLFTTLFRVVTAQSPIAARRDGVLLGVTGLWPAGTCQPTPRQRLAMAPAILGLGPGASRTLRWTKAWADRDPDEPHVHLGPLGVDAHLQGQGIGSQLLAEHCRRLDAGGEVGYLETDKAENVTFYARQGYETLEEAKVLGVPCWFMRRPPRGVEGTPSAGAGTGVASG